MQRSQEIGGVPRAKDVYARYRVASQSIPNGATTYLTWNVKVADTHSGMNTVSGTYTVPSNGRYMISSNCGITQGTDAITSITLFINGTASMRNAQKVSTSGVVTNGQSLCDIVELHAQDTIQIGVVQNQGISESISATTYDNNFCIIKLSELTF